MSLYPSYLMVSSKRYKAEQGTIPAFRFAWDDEISDYSYKCRTQSPGFVGPDNPPAVLRFYPSMSESGDYRVNLTKDPTWDWHGTFLAMNGGDEQKFTLWTKPGTAQFNTSGWAQMAYLGMSGNVIRVLERVGEWIRFATLKPGDWLKARSMSIASHPEYIHRFTCVSWDGVNKVTKRIESTGTPRGQIYYPLVTWEGSAWVPKRFVVAT